MAIKFKFDPLIKDGFYSSEYFKKTTKILNEFKKEQVVLMQFFQRHDDVMVSGISEVLALLEYAAIDYATLKIHSLSDGDMIDAYEPVLKIEGRYEQFGFLEGLIDGILSRNTSVATNSFNVVKAADGVPVLNMCDRADYYINQASDGYSSYVGGMRWFATSAALEYIDDKNVTSPSGTMPHALIQSFNGDVIKASKAFVKIYPNELLTVLIDYNNDCIVDGLKVAKHFGKKLYALRLDSAANLTDFYLQDKYKNKKTKYPLNGVSSYLIQHLREELNNAGFEHVKIIATSGFNPERIALFKKLNVPVDFYGVGAYLAQINIHFTGDLVRVDGLKEAKYGREEYESEHLIKRK